MSDQRNQPHFNPAKEEVDLRNAFRSDQRRHSKRHWIALFCLGLFCVTVAVGASLQRTVEITVIGTREIIQDTAQFHEIEPYLARFGNGVLRSCHPENIIKQNAGADCEALWPFEQEAHQSALENAKPCTVTNNNPLKLSSRVVPTTLSELKQGVTCAPVLLASAPHYPYAYQKDSRRSGLFTTEMRNYFKSGRIELYVIARNDGDDRLDIRYFVFAPNFEGSQELQWVSDDDTIDWGWTAPKIVTKPRAKRTRAEWQARSLSTNDPRWTDTAIALGRANASGCGEFYVSASGRAYCWESKQTWQIDFRARRAW